MQFLSGAVIGDTCPVFGLSEQLADLAETQLPQRPLVRHFEHFLDLGGQKHIGLGGDLDGCNPLAGGMQGVQDVPKLYDALKARGDSDELLEDVFFNNFMRII